MKQTVTKSSFIDTVRAHDRIDQFGIDGWKALFDYIEEYERGSGEEQELDVVGLCCELTRYESIDEFNTEQGECCDDVNDVAELTIVIEIPGSDAFLAFNY